MMLETDIRGRLKYVTMYHILINMFHILRKNFFEKFLIESTV
jgi:hypothetical protein